ncbi:YjjG family noncanonical pyrimidine nucleotidase [Paenibacillus filicis]|uniref:YjjG family noncanonical pyrimidine nucleotidase n=1 Tax=Paenibacillus filicis TaxID=669464 RepID=A0ABU9DHH0_9BACL
MYKAIIFDLDNTLLDYTRSELDSMRQTVRDHNLFIDEEAKWEVFWPTYLQHNFKHWMDFVHNLGPHASIHDVLRSSFRDTLNMSQSLHDELSNTYWHYFCNTCYFEEGALEVLNKLGASYPFGIISNGIHEAQQKRLLAGQIQDYFQSIVVSDKAGFRKPRKEIFDIALQELNVDRREVLFVGDSLSDDYQGALNAGIDFCFYNRAKQPVPVDIKPAYAIHELKELLQVV